VKLRYEDGPSPRLVSRLLTRLRAELEVAGFGIVTAGPAAEVAVTATDERVQLEISSSSHAVLSGTEREIPLLALQATEFLRAGLLPRATPPEPERKSDAPLPATFAPPPSPPRGAWSMDVSGSWLTGFRAGDHLPLVSVGATHRFPERLSLGLGGDVPLGPATFDAARGSAKYRIWLGALHADYAWWRSSRGTASLGLELGAARISSDGLPDAPLEARHPSRFALALGARLAAELRLSPSVALLAQARVLSLSPTPLVAVLDEERAVGNPSIIFGLGVRVGAF
jgi:hypothetical protein